MTKRNSVSIELRKGRASNRSRNMFFFFKITKGKGSVFVPKIEPNPSWNLIVKLPRKLDLDRFK